MCDLDGAKTNLESLLDIVRDLKAERDRLAKALLEISNLDTGDPWKTYQEMQQIAEQALAGKEGG